LLLLVKNIKAYYIRYKKSNHHKPQLFGQNKLFFLLQCHQLFFKKGKEVESLKDYLELLNLLILVLIVPIWQAYKQNKREKEEYKETIEVLKEEVAELKKSNKLLREEVSDLKHLLLSVIDDDKLRSYINKKGNIKCQI
jgi:tRNA-dihydrouridine synthase